MSGYWFRRYDCVFFVFLCWQCMIIILYIPVVPLYKRNLHWYFSSFNRDKCVKVVEILFFMRRLDGLLSCYINSILYKFRQKLHHQQFIFLGTTVFHFLLAGCCEVDNPIPFDVYPTERSIFDTGSLQALAVELDSLCPQFLDAFVLPELLACHNDPTIRHKKRH